MKEQYTTPTADVLLFTQEDIIATSGPTEPGNAPVELPYDDINS